MTNQPLCISGTSISTAWRDSLEALLRRGARAIEPLVVNIGDFGPDGVAQENLEVRRILDAAMTLNDGGRPVETVANTVFPQSLWARGAPRQELFSRYKTLWPRIKRHRANSHGVYFQRFIDFPGAPCDGNQLENVIQTFGQIHRRTALQVSVFDPKRDLTRTPRRGFPCLQHIVFAAEGRTGLSLTGFYALQYVVTKSYGNYLGLCRLGAFMAHEMGRELVRMTCVAAFAELGDGASKQAMRRLLADVDRALAEG